MRYKMRQWFTGLMALIMLASMLPVAALAESAAPPEEPEPTAQAETDGLPAPEDSADGDAAPETTQDPQEDAAPSPSPETEEDPEATPAPEAEADTEAPPSPEADPEADMDPSADAGEDLSPASDAIEAVQALIDALPDAEDITEDTRAEVEAQLAAIDEAKLALTDEQRAALDTARYEAAAAALLALDGADEPMPIVQEGEIDGFWYELESGKKLTLTARVESSELDLASAGGHPWDDQGIETVIVEGHVISIGAYCFQHWENLRSVTLPEGLMTIKQWAFESCSNLSEIQLPTTLVTIEDNAFPYCENLNLTKLPENIEIIGDYAFSECRNLRLTELPGGVQVIGDGAFSDCDHLALKSLPESLTEIGNSAFLKCTALGLTELPEGLRVIGRNAFSDCTGLTNLTMPASLERIGLHAFDGCTDLTLTFLGMTAPTVETGAFINVKEIHVPIGSAGYTTADWPQEKIKYDFSGGGTAEAPYEIRDKAQLKAFRDYINDGKGAGEYFKLTADIDLSGENWTPIGNSGSPFKGTFDGGGHTISVYINSPSSNNQGLFGSVCEGGTVKNLAVDGSVTGGDNVGGIVGDSSSSGATIENCYNKASVSGNSSVGGILGLSYEDSVINCYNTGTVTGGSNVGGIAGSGYPKIENCYNYGSIICSSYSYFGGIVGYGGFAKVTNCYYLDTCGAGGSGKEKSAADFRSLADTLGGAWEDDFLLGRPVLTSNRETGGGYGPEHPYEIPDKATLKALREYVNAGHSCAGIYFKLTADIDLTGEDWTPIGTDLDHPFNGTFDGGGHTVSGMTITGESLGGDVGFFGCTGKSATVKDLKVAGEIHGKNGTSDGGDVGGIVGRNDGAIENCENAVVIHVTGYASIGGIVGNSSGTISGCVNRGSVTGDGYTGGIAGYGLGTIENCKNTASIESDKYAAGGIAGNGNSNVSGCINTGPVTGGGSAGGIWGSGGAIVQNCGNSGTVTARGSGKAGGIFGSFFGHSGGTVYYAAENCCNTGSVTAEASGSAGGICGSDCEIKNSYYLDTCGAAGQGTAKTNWDFASGQVAYLLQAGQAAQVWGQSLGGDAPDTYPVLSGDGTKRICQVTFLTDLDRDYRALLYFNPNSAVGRLPEMPRIPGYVPVKWALTDSPDGEPFTAETVVTGDMTVYAIYEKCGDLTVSVANAGEGADPDREWRFRVEIDDPYYDGNGELTFTDGAAEFTLRAGESRTVPDLRPGTKYTVTELNADQDGYTAAATDAAGVIVSGETAAAAFTNTYGSAAPGPEESKDPDDTPTDSKSDGPKTGDESHMTYWLGLLCLSLTSMAAATLALVLDRKRPAPGRHARQR